MTREEHIKDLIDMMSDERKGARDYYLGDEDRELIAEALEKQIPKKPELYDKNYFCTECDALLFLFTDSYCSGCGQAIDWSKEYD